MAETKTQLEIVAEAFMELASIVNSPSPNVPVKKFSDACSLFLGLFGILATSFKFARIDFNGKVNDLAEASKTMSTLEVMVDEDIKANCVRRVGSHTRNLLRVKRALEYIKVLFEELVAFESGDTALKDAALKAYNQVFSRYHRYHIQKAAATGLDFLPKLAFLLYIIGETEETYKIHMQSFVNASATVIAYVDQLFLSKNLGIDWDMIRYALYAMRPRPSKQQIK